MQKAGKMKRLEHAEKFMFDSDINREPLKGYGMTRFIFIGKIPPLGWNQHRKKKLRTESWGIPFLQDKEEIQGNGIKHQQNS